MKNIKNCPLDAATEAAVTVFLERVAAVLPVQGAILFGSRARGNFQSDSDADVAVLLRGSGGQLMDARRILSGIAFDSMLETGILVEALPIWEEEWANPNEYCNPYLLRNIERDGVIFQ